MAQTKREKFERKKAHCMELADGGEIRQADADAILDWVNAYDPENTIITPNDSDSDVNRWGNSRQPTTLRQWVIAGLQYARELDTPLPEATAGDLNRVSQAIYDGTAENVKAGGMSKNSVRIRQNSIIKFLRHADAKADPDDISTFKQQSTVVDPEDMLTRDEFHALRDAPEHPRDKVIVDLFLHTGQRNTAIRTLRVKDIDVEDSKYRLNDTADGLKGADLIGTWNPLLAATGTVRDWLTHHPDSENPDAYLLCERRDSVVRDATETISDDTVNRTLRKAAKIATQDEPAIKRKPTTAHALRHNFVTMCKRDYDMDDDVIKRLIRHKPESDVMNTTYAHLSDSDYIKKAEEAFGIRDEDEESPMTPEHCDVCREPLPPTAKACANCGAVFTPDAKSAQGTMQDQAEERVIEAESEAEAKIVQSVLRDLRENPSEYINE